MDLELAAHRRSPVNEKVLPKLFVASLSAILLVALNYALPKRPVRTATIGEFQSVGFGHDRCRVIIYNASGFRVSGNYIVFDSFGQTRLPVVMLIGGVEIPETTSAFTGLCEGIVHAKKEGDPIEPPYIFVSDVKPR